MIISLETNFSFLKAHKVVAVIREVDPQKAHQSIEYAIQAGIKLIEITLTCPNYAQLLTHFKSQHPDLAFGFGTVISAQQMEELKSYNPDFIVSPAFSKEVLDVCLEHDILYLPGVFTPKEALDAFNLGVKVLKLFPSGILGHKFVSDVLKPFPFLNFMPSGGVDLENVTDWLNAGCIAISVGSSLFKGQTPAEKVAHAAKLVAKVKDAQ
ncbi:bifunctional 4-hydroxy-2-oxoglutarate aldolase/2-dehydro-3-deoxy-phosphogluconate aldolase [Mycoplasmopsis pullorum]|uniref:bifunctional 4-hydroxy-2-oxoglutarate aldolase/2-dehydro-3-deoxy-phosphogluconate aldolase n=1 Tax=Mycoplasmopsis pullorum TaxID=48003 RepID=UPI001F383FB7|nr:bifunctional 4-hydroxy-2-oxoglutarate aldolase/2-dehydro-3-deoxy-phosphogluconate aldolase [Mycoplasmopsis pullorum]